MLRISVDCCVACFCFCRASLCIRSVHIRNECGIKDMCTVWGSGLLYHHWGRQCCPHRSVDLVLVSHGNISLEALCFESHVLEL